MSLHPYFNKGSIDRLIKEYYKYDTLIIGFDFDNTIFDYHNIGGNFKYIIDLLKKCNELGFILCLFTVEDRLGWKIQYCEHFGINPDYVNDSPVHMVEKQKKPYFNLLLDDRAGLESACEILDKVIDYVENHQSKKKESEETSEILRGRSVIS